MIHTSWAKGRRLLSYQDVESQAFVVNQYIKTGTSHLDCVTELTGEDVEMYVWSAVDLVDCVIEGLICQC